jgi:hypothetical protein
MHSKTKKLDLQKRVLSCEDCSFFGFFFHQKLFLVVAEIHRSLWVVQDRATRSLQTLVNEVARIRSTRSGKPTWRAGRDEFKLLQSITANYFRERGAPKVYIYIFIFSALVAEIV